MSLLLSILPVAQAQSYSSPSLDTERWSWLFSGIGILIFLVFLGIYIAFFVIYYICIYNWGTTDSSSFPNGLSGKKTWFWLFFLVPVIVAVVFGWVPIVNIIIFVGLGIYMVIILIYYLVSIRPKTKEIQGLKPKESK